MCSPPQIPLGFDRGFVNKSGPRTTRRRLWQHLNLPVEASTSKGTRNQSKNHNQLRLCGERIDSQIESADLELGGLPKHQEPCCFCHVVTCKFMGFLEAIMLKYELLSLLITQRKINPEMSRAKIPGKVSLPKRHPGRGLPIFSEEESASKMSSRI